MSDAAASAGSRGKRRPYFSRIFQLPFDGTRLGRVDSALVISLAALTFFMKSYQFLSPLGIVYDKASLRNSHQRDGFFDLHPPLANLLTRLSRSISNWGEGIGNSDSWFKIGKASATSRIDVAGGVLMSSLAYSVLRTLHLNPLQAVLGSLLLLSEDVLVRSPTSIFLEIQAIGYVAATILCLKQFEVSSPFVKRWSTYLSLTGLSLGFVISVKHSGILVLVWVAATSTYRLRTALTNSQTTPIEVTKHIASRTFGFVLLPVTIYLTFSLIDRVSLHGTTSGGPRYESPSFPSKINTGLSAEMELPRWTHTPEEILNEAKELIEKEKVFNDKLASVQRPTIENVLVPLVEFENKHFSSANKLLFYEYVSPEKAVRDASTKARNLLNEHSIEESSRTDVYEVCNKLWEDIRDTNATDPETLKVLEKTVRSFKRNGLDLPDDKREHLKKLKLRLAELKTNFSKNTNEENGFLKLTLEELEGVPTTVIEQFEKTDEEGQESYKVTFKYPDISPVLKYARKESTRKLAYVENQNKVPENAPILKEIIEIRYQIAKLLNYETFSEYVLEERMAKNQKNVMAFLNDLRKKLTPLGEKELQRMKSFKETQLSTSGSTLQDEYYAWDHSFYNNLLLEQQYQVDHQKISEYFPLDQTIANMLGFYETLFDLKFQSVSNTDAETVWHPDVRKYAVFSNIKYNEPKNEFRGWIFFDLHPRDGKFTHAAKFELQAGYEKPDGSRQAPFCSIVCNFTKKMKNRPSLLKHNEVTTLFHELGHGIHSLLAKTKHARFHGTHVPRDFVECPSQMLEFWTWSPKELKALSSNYRTGEPLADELLHNLIGSKHVNSGLAYLRQLHFALFDMKLHTIADEEGIEALDLGALWNDLREDVALINSGVKTKGYATFGHIAGGYESGYYGYLYSQVFATDIYYTHFKSDPMNTERGIQYRDTILKRGGSEEILDILKELLGRQPNSEAFTKELLGES